MGRTANPGLAPVKLQPLNGEALLAGQNQMDSHSALVSVQFGDGLPYDRLRYLEKARYHMARSAEEALAVGNCLIVMKENEPHGEFMACIAELGLEYRLAARMMQATLKFGRLDSSTKLIEAAKSKSKLFELMVLDDEQLQALSEGGSVVGLDLDDIDRMPVSELRKALREAREDKDAQGRILADKNAKIDELATALQKKPLVVVLQPDERAKALRQEVAALAYEAEADITGKLREGFAKLAEHAEEHGVDHRVFQATLVRQLETLLSAIRSEFHLPADMDLEAAPDWLTADVDLGALLDEQAGA